MKKLIVLFCLFPLISSAQTWELVGGADISHSEVKLYSITLAPNGTLYVFYNRIESDLDSTKLFVRKFVNNQWQTLPNAPFGIFHDYNCHNRIQIQDEQNIYILFRQSRMGVNDVCSRVMKFDGNQWSYIGDSIFMPEFANTNLLLVNQQPVLPYYEKDSLRLMVYNTTWTNIAHPIANTSGNTFLISSEVYDNKVYFLLLNNGEYQIYTWQNNTWQMEATVPHPNNDSLFFEMGNIRINSQHEIYVHLFALNTQNLFVYKVANGIVHSVGQNSSLLTSKTGYAQMNLDKSGLPVVAFCDQLYNSELSVMHYDGNTWNFIGDRGFTTNKRSDVQGLVIDQNNIPYVAVVKRVMFDGYVNIWTLKQPISVSESVPLHKMQVFPNPVKDILQVHLPINTSAKNLKIYDMQGKIVFQNASSFSTNTGVQTELLISGTYILQITTTTGEIMYQKFVKE